MGHVVLLGDSIFDNERYVPDRPPVIEQVRQALPQGWTATLLAIDGDTVEGVPDQLRRLPADATHLFVSVGGNDALGESALLHERASTVGEALYRFHDALARFRTAYHAMLKSLLAVGEPCTVCTIYDAVPGLGPAERGALAGFNDVILREAVAAGMPIIDLRLVCNQASDYSHVSPIEPSATGGAKIARVIAQIAMTHDFQADRTTIYV